ncbi:MAG: ParA family protein [Rickettsiaceae bacterium]|nr:ParA family protein [Rickettsiaceae bacterium]
MSAKIITISQQKGGAGKSTIAVHLAVGLCKKNLKVGLVDIDPQMSSSIWHEEREKNREKQYITLGFTRASGIRLAGEINALKLRFDYIIIDCPPHTESDAKSAIRLADLVLIPMQPSPTDLWATSSTLDYAILEQKKVKILLNRYNPSTKLINKLDVPKKYLLNTTIGNRVGFASSMLSGGTIVETDPSSIGAQEVENLVSEILALL